MPLVPRRWALAALALFAAMLVFRPLSNLIYAGRLAWILKYQASNAFAGNHTVRQVKICRRHGSASYEALIYYPVKKSARTAVILSAGLSELGCYHPGLIAFSRSMANMGLLVVTPDIGMFRKFEISAKPIEQMIFWYEQIGSFEGSEDVRKIGLAGISFSGTLALMAAARPEIRDKVSFAIAIGPYHSLIRCARGWFAAGPVTVAKEDYPTRFYAKWIIMLAALDMLPALEDRVFLNSVLNALLLEKQVPRPPSGLTAEGKRWYRLATLREDQSDWELANRIQEHLLAKIYHELDPDPLLSDLRCPTFLLHGAYDDLIPSQESRELHRRIDRSYLLITPFLTHTHPSRNRLGLHRKLGAILDTVLFCYRLAQAIQ